MLGSSQSATAVRSKSATGVYTFMSATTTPVIFQRPDVPVM